MSNSSDPTKTGVLEGESKRKCKIVNYYNFNENVCTSFIQKIDIQPHSSVQACKMNKWLKVLSLEKQSCREDELFKQVVKI